MRYGIGDDLTAAIRCYQGHQHRERWKEPRRKRAERRACPAALHSASKLGGEMVARYFSETFDCVAANNPGLCKLKLACLATVSLPRTPPGSDPACCRLAAAVLLPALWAAATRSRWAFFGCWLLGCAVVASQAT